MQPKQLLSSLIMVFASGVGMVVLQMPRVTKLVDDQPSATSSREAMIAQDQNIEFQLTLLKQTPNFGFDNVLSDWTYLQFLQYFGDTAIRQQIGYGISPLFFENIVDRDPRFVWAYLYLSNSVSIYAAQPDVAVSLMARGLQSMTPTVPPQSYFVWRYKAVDELLFLADGTAAKESYEISVDWAMQSSDPQAEAVAQLSQRSVDFLSQNPDSRPAQISAWTQVLASAVDDHTRQLAVQAIEALGGTITISNKGQAIVEYQIDDPAQDIDSSETQNSEVLTSPEN